MKGEAKSYPQNQIVAYFVKDKSDMHCLAK